MSTSGARREDEGAKAKLLEDAEGNTYDDDSDDDDDLLDPSNRRGAKNDAVSAAREKESARFFALLDRIRARLRVRRSLNAIATTSNAPWDRILRVKEVHICIFSMVGLVFSMLLSVYKWHERCIPDADGNCHPEWPQDDENEGIVAASADNTFEYMQNVFATLVGCQIVISVSSLVTVFLIVQYYGLRLTERQREWSGVEEVDRIEASGGEKTKLEQFFRASYRFWDSTLRWSMLLEIVVHCFYPVLWFESLGPGGSTVEEVAESFVFVRLYLILRVAYIHSDTYVFRADILKANKELQLSGYRVNPMTTFKILFYRHPGKMIVSLVVALLLVFSFCIFVVERNNNKDLSNLGNCFWFAFITLATIGFGDYTAISPTGRIVVILMATVMQFIMVLFAGVVTNLLSPTRELKYVQQFLEQRSADAEYLKAAVRLIEVTYLERKRRRQSAGAKNADRGSISVFAKRSPEVYSAMKVLKSVRQTIRQSLGAASDSVIDEKLQEVIVLANDINKTLHEQGMAILFLNHRVVRATATVKQRLSLGTSSTAKKGSVKLDVVEKLKDTKKYPYEQYVKVH